jgi:hypothetical protein
MKPNEDMNGRKAAEAYESWKDNEPLKEIAIEIKDEAMLKSKAPAEDKEALKDKSCTNS